MRIGFLGGAFDPVHVGHLSAAQDAFEQCPLDRLVFVPAAQAPLKPHDVQAGPEERLAMIRAVIGRDPRFQVSDFEIRRGGISYTIDSARHFRGLHPADDLCWIIGSDQAARLHQWRDIGEIVRLVEFVVMERPDHPAPDPAEIPGLRIRRLRGHTMTVSSTELRARARRGLPLWPFVPPEALALIREHNSYRNTQPA